MVGKVSESKENAKIRSFNFNNGSTCKVFRVNKLIVEMGEFF